MSTRQVTVKATKDLPNLGVPVYLQIVDDQIEAIIVGEGDNSIRITKAASYSDHLRVTMQQVAKTKEVYIVQGKLLGLSDYCSEEFDSEGTALGHYQDLVNEHGPNLGLKVLPKVVTYFEDKLA